jgi:hypothetical protein
MMTVKIDINRTVNIHPTNCLVHLLTLLILICSQIISLGSGASIMIIFSTSSPSNNCFRFYKASLSCFFF